MDVTAGPVRVGDYSGTEAIQVLRGLNGNE